MLKNATYVKVTEEIIISLMFIRINKTILSYEECTYDCRFMFIAENGVNSQVEDIIFVNGLFMTLI